MEPVDEVEEEVTPEAVEETVEEVPAESPVEVAEAALEAVPERTEPPIVLVDGDVIGVVEPGAVDGLAALVVRSLGGGDSGKYEDHLVERVMQIQSDAGLPDDGVVAGETWAHILRTLQLGMSGHEVLILSRLLNMNDTTFFSETVERGVRLLQAANGLFIDGVVDTDTWIAAIVEAQAREI